MSNPGRNAAQKLLQAFRSMLAEDLKSFNHLAIQNKQDTDTPIQMTRAGFILGIRTIDAVIRLLPDPNLDVLAFGLCRPFYELSNRLLWAVRSKDGYLRLQKYLVKEHLKWANEASCFENLKEYADKNKTEMKKVLDHTDEEGHAVQPIPNMQEVLIEIDCVDHEDGFYLEPQHGPYQYTNVYRKMCEAAHGNYVAEDESNPILLRFLVIGIMLAVSAQLRTFCFIVYPSNQEKPEIEKRFKVVRKTVGNFFDIQKQHE